MSDHAFYKLMALYYGYETIYYAELYNRYHVLLPKLMHVEQQRMEYMRLAYNLPSYWHEIPHGT